LQLDQHLQSLQIVWTNRTIQTPTPSDLKLGKMSSKLEKGRKRLAIEESHWWLNGVDEPNHSLTGLVFALQTAGAQRIEVHTLAWRHNRWDES
jgi:hypothetical protein